MRGLVVTLGLAMAVIALGDRARAAPVLSECAGHCLSEAVAEGSA